VRRYGKADEPGRSSIYRAYLARTAFINNWDLVDSSAPQIVGAWLLEYPCDRGILNKLTASRLLWDRRIAMLSTFAFIRAGEHAIAVDIATCLVHDPHDLIHKAVGWMLRETGQRDPAALREFLKTHAATMPRTALRYAIEKLSPEERAEWLARRAS
jgi:3-methyladenine DNA glycosylase AlkD